MGWLDRLLIKFYLVRIYIKLFVMYWNPWSNLYRNEVVFFLARKAGRASRDPTESVGEDELLEEVSLLGSTKSEK